MRPGDIVRLFFVLPFVAASIDAQDSGKVFRHHDRPIGRATLDLATGTIKRGPAVHDRFGTTVTDFYNLDVGPGIGVDTGNGFCEWFSAGTKGFAGNQCDLMSDIVFAYCSAKLSTEFGGPGGSATLGFYEGYTVGGVTPSTAVASLALTGLPGNTSSSSFFAGFTCYFLKVRFGALVPFADGPIGYSFRFMDVGSIGTLAATFPFLACVQSCSGPGPDGQGMVNVMDEYCPVGTLRASFTFGSTVQAYFTSMTMSIREAFDLHATATPFNGDNVNVDVLTAGPIVVGQTWNVALHVPGGPHHHGTAAAAPMTARVRTSPVNGPNVVSPIGGRLTEVLIHGPLLAIVSGTHTLTGGTVRDGAFPPQSVPPSLGVVALPWAVQASVVGGGFADLSTAVAGVTGTL